MKKLFFLVFLFAVTLGVLVFLGSWRPVSVPKETIPSLPAPSADLRTLSPSFPLPAGGSQPSYIVPPTARSFPASLPQYRINLVTQKTIAQGVAAALEFSGGPAAFSSTRETFYSWNRSNASLSIGGTPLGANYSSGQTASGVVATPIKELDFLGRKHLASVGLPQEPYQLAVSSLKYFTLSGFDLRETKNPAGATIVQLSYQFLLQNRPFFTGRLDESGTVVRFNSKKEVVGSVFVIPPPLFLTTEATPVVPVEEGVSRLQRGEGVLVSLFADGVSEFSAPQYLASAGVVKETVLGYYWGKGQTTLVPVYLFRGTTTDIGSGTPLTFATIVSALPTK